MNIFWISQGEKVQVICHIDCSWWQLSSETNPKQVLAGKLQQNGMAQILIAPFAEMNEHCASWITSNNFINSFRMNNAMGLSPSAHICHVWLLCTRKQARKKEKNYK